MYPNHVTYTLVCVIIVITRRPARVSNMAPSTQDAQEEHNPPYRGTHHYKYVNVDWFLAVVWRKTRHSWSRQTLLPKEEKKQKIL